VSGRVPLGTPLGGVRPGEAQLDECCGPLGNDQIDRRIPRRFVARGGYPRGEGRNRAGDPIGKLLPARLLPIEIDQHGGRQGGGRGEGIGHGTYDCNLRVRESSKTG